MLLTRTNRRVLAIIGSMIMGAGVVCAQDYPTKPIRILTSEAGGGTDIQARLIAQGITGPLGQPVIVENRGSQLIGDLGAKAPPDGYTILLASSTVLVSPLLEKRSYDALKDFVPITLATRSPLLLIVHPSLPVKSVKEFIALAKSRPGALNYGSGGTGSSGHLGAELFNSMAGINTVRINYKGTGPAINATAAGEVQWMIAAPSAVTPHLKSNRLKVLAVTTPEPSRLYPGMATIATILPGYDISARSGVLAPARTPMAIITRLNQEIVRVLNQADVKEKLFGLGVEAAPNSPEEYSAMIKTELEKLGKVIRDANIKLE